MKRRASGLVAMVVALVLLAAAPALAWWIDNVSVSGTSITAGKLQPPTGLKCTTSGVLTKSVTLNWTAPTSGATPAGYTILVNGAVNGSTSGTSYTINPGLLSLGTYPVTVESVYPLPTGTTAPQWFSATSNTVNITALTSVIVQCA
jgi:hypothetical protein